MWTPAPPVSRAIFRVVWRFLSFFLWRDETKRLRRHDQDPRYTKIVLTTNKNTQICAAALKRTGAHNKKGAALPCVGRTRDPTNHPGRVIRPLWRTVERRHVTIYIYYNIMYNILCINSSMIGTQTWLNHFLIGATMKNIT